MSRKIVYFLAITNAIFLNGSLQADDFYHRSSIDLKERALSSKKMSLLYLSCGYSNLISEKYRNALEDYQNALGYLQNTDHFGVEFLASFGMVVACDRLQLGNDTQKHLFHIRRLIETCSPENHDMTESLSRDARQVAEHLRQIAFLSSSRETRDLLVSFISEIFPSALASNSSMTLAPKMPSQFLSSKNTLKPMSCRSFWKTMKKIRDSIVETWNAFFQIYKDIKEIRDDLNGNPPKPV